MRRIGSLLMSTVLVTGCAGLATNNDSLRTILERNGQTQPKLSAYDLGKRHLQFGQAGLAVQAFEEALKANPDSIPVLNGLAVAYDRLGRGEVAQRYLDRALALDPDSVVTLNNLAYLNLVQGNTAVALAYTERAKLAAALPMDMMLPETIANAVDRNADIATQIAANEKQERRVAQAPASPPESDIKRLGLNEWQLRIRPPNPADAVRINLPIRDAAPRVIEPMVSPVIAPMAVDPLTKAVVVSDIPDSVMADLMPRAPEVPPAETVVALLPPAAVSEPAAMALDVPASGEVIAASEPEEPRLEPGDAIVTPVSPIPEPVMASLIEPPAIESVPVPTAPIAVVLPESIASTGDPIAVVPATVPELPPQPSSEPIESLPAVAAPRVFVAPAPDAIAAVLPVVPVVPPMKLPEPVREEPMVVALAATEPPRTFAPPTPEAIATVLPVVPVMPPQELPESAREEPIVVALAATESQRTFAPPTPDAIATVLPVVPVMPPQDLPEPAREELVVAVLPAPEPVPVHAIPVVEAAAPRVLPALPPQHLLTPVREEPAIAVVSQPEPAEPLQLLLSPMMTTADPSPASPTEPMSVTDAAANLKSVVASLVAQPSPPVVSITPPDEGLRPVQPIAPAVATPPAARVAEPMMASLAPSRVTAPRSVEPAGLKSDWQASVPASTYVRISNGTGRRQMAGRFAHYFSGHGLSARRIANANSFDYRRTVIFYNPDQRANAEALAAVLPFPVRLAEAKQGRGQIELVLGFDLLSLDDALRSS